MPALGDLVRVTVYCKNAEQTSINVLHYLLYSLSASGLTYASVGTKFITALRAKYMAVMPDSCTFLGLSVQKIRPIPEETTYWYKNHGNGVLESDVLPRQTSGLISHKTAMGGRKNHGRVYVPFPYEGANTTEGKPSAAYLVDLQELADAMKTVIATDDVGEQRYALVVYHRPSGLAESSVEVVAKGKWATQRRRGSYGRPNPPPDDLA